MPSLPFRPLIYSAAARCRWSFMIWVVVAACEAAICYVPPSLAAQDLRARDTPLTAWLDLRPANPGASAQTTPGWIEAFEFIPAKAATADPTDLAPPSKGAEQAFADATNPPAPAGNSIFRIRIQRPAAAVNNLQVRVFFDDRSLEARPLVSVWNELGEELMRSDFLGQGLGLPSSETLMVPMKGIDYLEIEAPGDGSQVRSVFLSWLEKTHVLQPADFPSNEAVREPFHIQSITTTHRTDDYLFGVVKARLLSSKPLVLDAVKVPRGTFEFQLDSAPLMAVVTYEMLGATVGSAPLVSVDQRVIGVSEVSLPDLADPGYQGQSREGEERMRFRYTGWVRAQKVISGESLSAGLNTLALALSEGSDPVAIRSVEIQLKYNWEKLDYTLAPAPIHYDSQ